MTTRQELLDRQDLLYQEITDNEDENRLMQQEIDEIEKTLEEMDKRK